MCTSGTKSDFLHTINKTDAGYLLIGIQEAKSKGFDINGCNIDIILNEDIASQKKTYIISFYPREVTPENAMGYEILLDDLDVYIDAETKTIIRSCASI